MAPFSASQHAWAWQAYSIKVHNKINREQLHVVLHGDKVFFVVLFFLLWHLCFSLSLFFLNCHTFFTFKIIFYIFLNLFLLQIIIPRRILIFLNLSVTSFLHFSKKFWLIFSQIYIVWSLQN